MPHLDDKPDHPAHSSSESAELAAPKVGSGLALIVATFVVVVASLLALTNVRTRILSAVRAYVAGEGSYSKGQKDAIHHLHRFARTGDERDFEEFEAALAIPLGDRTARKELERSSPDMDVVRAGFVAGGNHPDDVDDMAMLFRRFRKVSYIDAAVDAWERGDALIMDLGDIGDRLHAEMRATHPSAENVTRILDEADALNRQITVLENRFSETLGEGNRWLEQRLAELTYAVAAVLVLGGVFLSWIIYRRTSSTEHERHDAERALRRSEERYRSLVAVTTSVVWSTDANGFARSPQRDWQAYTGCTWDENTPHGWRDPVHPDDRDAILETWQRARRSRTVFYSEGRILHAASGRYRHFVAHAVPLLAADGSIREWIGTLTDVDERKRAEEALHAASRQKDEFLAMLAHELRNPLSPIRNAVYILRSIGGTEPRVVHAHEMIERQVTHMSRLLDDLLDVSRVARGKVALREEILDLGRLVRVTAEDYRPAMEQARLQLSVELPSQPIWIRGDATRLAQVLGNLLHNALKFTAGGGSVRVTASRDTDTAHVSVKDSGVGVDPSELQRVFDVFTQADQGLDRSRGGLGLGLALVRGLVQLHGGRVHAYSAGAGRGFEVTVDLPATSAPEAAAVTPPPAVEHDSAHRRRVLVVEDNVDVAESVRELLEIKGHEVAVARTGQEALAIARARRPDVVLCDIGLPGGMSGFDVAERLRSDRSAGTPCLIAITGYGRSEDRRRAHEAGFDMHLIKPIDPSILDRLLARAAERIVA